MKYLRIITLALLTLAATPALAEFEGRLFLTAAWEYQIDSLSSDWAHTGCKTRTALNDETISVCTGENPLAEFKLGYEFGFGRWRDKWYLPTIQVGWKHRSHYFTGPPFNDEGEVTTESAFISFKIGGLR